jgi:hypothetical protein
MAQLKKLGSLGKAYLETWTLDRFGIANATMAQRMERGAGKPPTPTHELINQHMVEMRSQWQPQDGVWYIRWYFEGLWQDRNYIEYELETTERDVPLEVHPNIADLLAKYEGWWDSTGLHFFPTYGAGSSGGLNQSGAKKNPLYGVQSYMDVGAVWRRIRVLESVPPGEPGKVVEQPPTQKVPPTLATGLRNWLTMPVRSRKRGLVWEVTEEWMLSGRGGWNKLIYS